MNYFSRLLLTGMLAAASTSAFAQQRFSSEAATAEQRLVEDIGTEQLLTAVPTSTVSDIRNRSTLMQNGNNNTATLDQRSLSAVGNQAYITQAGALNVLGLTQTGGITKLT